MDIARIRGEASRYFDQARREAERLWVHRPVRIAAYAAGGLFVVWFVIWLAIARGGLTVAGERGWGRWTWMACRVMRLYFYTVFDGKATSAAFVLSALEVK